MEIRTINKIYGKLKMKCFEMPNASYTNRCAPACLRKGDLLEREDYQKIAAFRWFQLLGTPDGIG